MGRRHACVCVRPRRLYPPSSQIEALEKERDENKARLDTALASHADGEALKAAHDEADAAKAQIEELSKERDELKRQAEENAVMTQAVRVTEEEVKMARSLLSTGRSMRHAATPEEKKEAEDMVKLYESQGVCTRALGPKAVGCKFTTS